VLNPKHVLKSSIKWLHLSNFLSILCSCVIIFSLSIRRVGSAQTISHARPSTPRGHLQIQARSSWNNQAPSPAHQPSQRRCLCHQILWRTKSSQPKGWNTLRLLWGHQPPLENRVGWVRRSAVISFITIIYHTNAQKSRDNVAHLAVGTVLAGARKSVRL